MNNAYLVNVRHDLALVYNDASVLENRHLAAMYGLLAGRPGADVLAALEPSRWRELRRLIINAVIHTDMVHHFPLVSKARTGSPFERFSENPGTCYQAAHFGVMHVIILLAWGNVLPGAVAAWKVSKGSGSHTYSLSQPQRQVPLDCTGDAVWHCAD